MGAPVKGPAVGRESGRVEGPGQGGLVGIQAAQRYLIGGCAGHGVDCTEGRVRRRPEDGVQHVPRYLSRYGTR